MEQTPGYQVVVVEHDAVWAEVGDHRAGPVLVLRQLFDEAPAAFAERVAARLVRLRQRARVRGTILVPGRGVTPEISGMRVDLTRALTRVSGAPPVFRRPSQPARGWIPLRGQAFGQRDGVAAALTGASP